MQKAKCALIRRNGLGDFISATVPFYQFLEDMHPEIELHLFLSKANYALAPLLVPNARFSLFQAGNKYLSTVCMALQNRQQHFTYAVAPVPQYNKLNDLFCWLIGARERYAANTGILFDRLLINNLRPPRGKLHVGLETIKIFDPSVQVLKRAWYPKIDRGLLPKNHYPYEDNALYKACVKIMIEVSNNRTATQLSNDKQIYILNALSQQHNILVLISYLPKDYPKARAIIQSLNVPAFAIETPALMDYIFFLASADVFMLGDGGGGHICGALGLYGLSLYQQRQSVAWQVMSDRVIQLSDPDDNINNIDNVVIVDYMDKLINMWKRCKKL